MLVQGSECSSLLDAHLHQLVPGRVELDLVDAVAVAVERVQDGLVLVRQAAPLLLRLTADEAAERGGALAHPAGPLALGRLDEREVAREHVDALERRHLVEHRVRLPRCVVLSGSRHRAGHADSLAEIASLVAFATTAHATMDGAVLLRG